MRSMRLMSILLVLGLPYAQVANANIFEKVKGIARACGVELAGAPVLHQKELTLALELLSETHFNLLPTMRQSLGIEVSLAEIYSDLFFMGLEKTSDRSLKVLSNGIQISVTTKKDKSYLVIARKGFSAMGIDVSDFEILLSAQDSPLVLRFFEEQMPRKKALDLLEILDTIAFREFEKHVRKSFQTLLSFAEHFSMNPILHADFSAKFQQSDLGLNSFGELVVTTIGEFSFIENTIYEPVSIQLSSFLLGKAKEDIAFWAYDEPMMATDPIGRELNFFGNRFGPRFYAFRSKPQFLLQLFFMSESRREKFPSLKTFYRAASFNPGADGI